MVQFLLLQQGLIDVYKCADLMVNSLSVDLTTIPALTTIDLVFKVTGTSDNKYVFGIGGRFIEG